MSTWKPTDDKDNKRYQNDSFQNRSLSQSKELNTSSMTTLILWNINKALEKNPTLDLKTALLNAQDKLESEHGNVSAIVNQRPDERHLSCALLAWQQLGHCHVDSLYSFVVAQMKAEPKIQTSSPRPGQSNMGSSKVPYARSLITHKEPDFMFSPISSNMSPPAMGPVLRLPSSRPAPVASRVALPGPSTTWVAMPAPIAPVPVIPVYNVQGGGGCSALRKTGQDLKKRIESACCLESACLEHFTAVDRSTKELRMRLSRLAKREADRIELLSRAEAAWRDLEMGYIRRLRTNVEKEDEIKRRGAKTIAERNADKEACVKIVASLKPCGEVAEKIKLTLGSLEKNVCDLACESLKQRELAAKEDSTLCELQCQANRQDRDLQFREEAARRKKASLENEVESVRGLAYEIERTIKAELKGFEAQIKAVANELLAENEEIDKLKKERDELAEEKQEIVEDLEGCQKKCDDSMKKNLDELKEKRDKLFKLKDQTLECKCKFPMESAVQVKRTPSFAALCYCSPEDKLKKTCSCMSMRSRLLSDLIVTLFEGLQFELADCSIKMPCELLKCLEDSFNWDKGSHVKSNLRAFFAKMLCGELDIAIVNSIDNYHARYVGASCADKGRSIQNLTDSNTQRWEDRALAEKARLMAETMAEQMYQERVDDIMDEAHKVVKEGPPPCKCKPPPNLNKEDTAVYQLLVNPVLMSDNAPQECFSPVQQPLPISSTSDNEPTASDAVVAAAPIKQKKKAKETKNTAKIFKEPPSSIVARTFKNDVLLLKAEIAGLKKESIKKQDLRKIEQTIKKLVQKESSHNNQIEKSLDVNGSAHANTVDGKNIKQKSTKGKLTKKKKIGLNFRTQYAVNMCFCGLHNSRKSSKQQLNELVVGSNALLDKKSSKEQISQNISEKQSKAPFILNSQKYERSEQIISLVNQVEITKPRSSMHNQLEETNQGSCLDNQLKNNNKCGSKCECFHKIPSTSSIDRLLETLMKWKTDLNEPPHLSDEVESEIFSKRSSQKCSSNIKDTFATECRSNVTKDSGKEVSVKISPQKCPSNIKVIPASTCRSNVTNGSCKFDNKSDIQLNTESAHRKTCELLEAESKYMRTINLEKSNENISKCVDTKDKSREKIDINESKESKKSKISVQSKKNCRSKSKVVVAKHAESKIRRKVKSEECKQKKNSFIKQRKIKSLNVCKPRDNVDDYDHISVSNNTCLKKFSSTLKNEEQNTNEMDKGKPIPLILVDNTSNDQYKEHISLRSNFTLQEQRKELTSLRSNFTLQEQHKEPTSLRSNFTLQEPYIDSLINPSDLSCGCEYQIKLIGVTLDNIYTNKNINNKLEKTENEVGSAHPKQLRYKKQEKKAQENSDYYILPISDPHKSKENYDLFKCSKTDINELELKQPLCQCKSKLNEIESLLLNINKNRKEIRDDKALDTHSLKAKVKSNTRLDFKDSLKVDSSKCDYKDENCVCCVDLSNESKELEVNTFQLLQEHIRNKLQCMKDTCQSAYCIKPDEEDKVLKRLFFKIKQTITDGTGKIACKCSEETGSKGSWERAYNLLQEYLKIKISRVECSCFLGENKKETILPALTDKVCILIEKDFERLRDICKCRNKGKLTKTTFDEETKFQMPEKDNNNKVEISDNKTLKKSSILKELSSKSYIFAINTTSAQVIPSFETKSCEAMKFSDPVKNTVETQSSNNTSAQVIPNFDTKSCEAIKFPDRVKNTVETQSSNEYQHLKKTGTIDSIYLDATKIINCQSTQYSTGDDKEVDYYTSFEQCVKKSEHILSEFKELAEELTRRDTKIADQSLPYIGLTIDCTCGQTLEKCGCSKARIGDNNKAIAEFWATYTKSKATLKNVSYVMKNTHQNLRENVASNSAKKITSQCYIKKSDKKVNTKNVGRGLTLKKSQEFLKRTSCGGTNTDDSSFSSASDNSSIEDWDAQDNDFDENNETVKQPKKKFVHFLHKSKSEVKQKLSEVYHKDCDCSKVPVCHVKMLVENIESKLVNSECVCDTLSSKVCPIHTKADT